jgi:hypothetical protein
MSKKSRRARAKRRAGGQGAQTLRSERVQVPKSIAASKATTPLVEPARSLVKPAQYQHVLPELRRIGIIAGALFLILIVLTFVLR